MAEILSVTNFEYQSFRIPYGGSGGIVVPMLVLDDVYTPGTTVAVVAGDAQNNDVYNHTVPILISNDNLSPIPELGTTDPLDWYVTGESGTKYTLRKSANKIHVVNYNTDAIIWSLTGGATSDRGGMWLGFLVDAERKPLYLETLSTYVTYSGGDSYTPASNTDFGLFLKVNFNYFFSTSNMVLATVEQAAQFSDFINAWYRASRTQNDPYENGGISNTGGGTGDFDGTGDLVQIPGLPSFSAVDTGMISLYAPTVQDLKALANYLWGSLDLTNWNRILTDPMQAVLGLSIVPVSATKGSSKSVWVGNINTNVPMVQYASQYAEVDCGTLNVNEYWGGYLDYDPYTKAELYLPYIGARPIAVDDIMGKSVHVVYHVDILSGACVAYVEVDGTVLYNFIGQCSCSIPISGGDWTNVLNGVLQIASAVGMMVATEGASIPATIGAAGSAASGMVNAMRPNIEKSGAMSGMGGMMGVQTPYLILTRPRQCLPANQNKIEGYPSFITAQLGELAGFTVVHKIELFDIGATREEYAEIEQLLTEGVIL